MDRQRIMSRTTPRVRYGRNRLIAEYLWMRFWKLYPLGDGELIPNHPGRAGSVDRRAHPMYRTPKQISSHAQVLKGFFADSVISHFFLPAKQSARGEGKGLTREGTNPDPFKNNKTLASIANGDLPDERPNYEYFSLLLAADKEVMLRPRECYIFVSSSSAIPQSVLSSQGVETQIAEYNTSDDQCVHAADYPNLKLNKEEDVDMFQDVGHPVLLLHEYARGLSQKQSSCVQEISHRWDVDFPSLSSKMAAAYATTATSGEQTSRRIVGATSAL
ncbi:hypothetical protein F4778DRAFT_721161, partial [Xylariomycetidae sp. FL2044]